MEYHVPVLDMFTGFTRVDFGRSLWRRCGIIAVNGVGMLNTQTIIAALKFKDRIYSNVLSSHPRNRGDTAFSFYAHHV